MTTMSRGAQRQEFELHTAGEQPGQQVRGGLVCVDCGYAISLMAQDTLPRCPACEGQSFRRASMFEQPTLDTEAIAPPGAEPSAVVNARQRLAEGDAHLVWEADGEVNEVSLEAGWAKIGRSSCADIRLDDPTVSRRHAMVVLTEEGKLRALDDRSLNGLFVNGERVEWTALADGDELEIGRFRIHVVT